MNRNLMIVVLLLSLASGLARGAAKNPVVGGQEMLPANTLLENLSKSADHTTLIVAIKAAGLEETLAAPGPITVFAPTNKAFAEMPEGLLDRLMKPENKEELKKTLLYNMLQGQWSTADLKKKIKESKDGLGELTSIEGSKLKIADHNGMHLMIRSEDDDIGMFSVWDVACSNGIFHVVDNVMQLKEQ
jgi:uncharacterized surface protein with fasciclin (FAS1) repeats